MHLAWTDERCILCTLAPLERQARCGRTARLTKEHLIPEAIGGRLTCDFLCQHCNSILGQIEALLKEDSGIRLAIDNLKASLPDLWATMAEGRPYIAVGPDGTVDAELKNGEIRVNSSKRLDGSIIRPLDDSAKAVRTMLQRRGATQGEITNAEMKLGELPEGPRVKIADGIEVMKSTVDVYPAYSSRRIEPLALLKIAYEYLALHLRSKIFDPYFDPVRSALVTEGPFPSSCSVEEMRVRDRKYQPFHGLAVKNASGGMKVTIRLFGYFSYRIQFLRLKIVNVGLFCYTLHLDSQEEECVESEPA